MRFYNAITRRIADPDMSRPTRTELPWLHSFPASASEHARVLILGSMPGAASLAANRYYAHPRNQFWPILSALLQCDLVARDYPQRLRTLNRCGIALWDVLQTCRRPGSLDADIAADSIRANDFTGFFRRHGNIHHVFCNGAAAERFYKQHVQPRQVLPPLRYQRLPSTSPAHAALDFAGKLAAWRAMSQILGQTEDSTANMKMQ
jgi:double-stranded uracil-DNA glycosylase